jgi:hypothetical protein
VKDELANIRAFVRWKVLLLQCHFVHRKTHMDWAGVATGIPRQGAGSQLHEPRHGRFGDGFRKLLVILSSDRDLNPGHSGNKASVLNALPRCPILWAPFPLFTGEWYSSISDWPQRFVMSRHVLLVVVDSGGRRSNKPVVSKSKETQVSDNESVGS